ncbi:MAG: ribonuclease III [Bacteroidetes bacterium]|nr:ribonuclease III [Bacteroidota bacterium]
MLPSSSNTTKPNKRLAVRLFLSSASKRFSDQIYRLTGLKPRRLAIYREAFRHSSVNIADKTDKSLADNERLEFLGDAILDAVVAEMLFMRYPLKQEGFLTEMRMRVVNREQMSYLANRLGLVQMMDLKPELLKQPFAVKSIAGNALEALIGAVYLDHGYIKARSFITRRLIGQYLDLEKLMSTTISYKAVLLKWSQQQKKIISWAHKTETHGRRDLHVVSVLVDEQLIATDKNLSRKKAEELCCEKACRILNIQG